jgi:hypothetical protein
MGPIFVAHWASFPLIPSGKIVVRRGSALQFRRIERNWKMANSTLLMFRKEVQAKLEEWNTSKTATVEQKQAAESLLAAIDHYEKQSNGSSFGKAIPATGPNRR